MSEICFECLNKTFGGKLESKRYVISKELELCEHCGEYKRVVVVERNRYYYLRRLRIVLVPLSIILFPITLAALLIYRAHWKRKIQIKPKIKA